MRNKGRAEKRELYRSHYEARSTAAAGLVLPRVEKASVEFRLWERGLYNGARGGGKNIRRLSGMTLLATGLCEAQQGLTVRRLGRTNFATPPPLR